MGVKLEQKKAVLAKWIGTMPSKVPPSRKDVEKSKMEQVALRQKEVELNGAAQDQFLKRKIFDWVRFVVLIYLVMVMFIVAFSQKLGLSDGVVIALLSTTTVNVVGLPALMIKSLFSKNKKSV
jgi:hypothetical protein